MNKQSLANVGNGLCNAVIKKEKNIGMLTWRNLKITMQTRRNQTQENT